MPMRAAPMLQALLLCSCWIAPAAVQGACILRTGFDASHRGVVAQPQFWQPTFSTYLKHALGQELNCTFETVVIPTIDGLFDAAQAGSIDFVMTDVAIRECLESEFGVSAMATLVNLANGSETTFYGGSILVRANRTDINSLADVVGKKLVAGASPALAAGCQMQWGEMQASGVNIFTDAIQVNFALESQAAVNDVLSGAADVAFARSDLLWRMAAQGMVDPQDFKVLAARSYPNYPYPISTPLYPEWAVGALPHVPPDIRSQVAIALMRMSAGDPAARQAGYSRWTSPYAYAQVNRLQARLQYVSSEGRCLRSTDFFGAITCPPKHVKRPEADVMTAEGCVSHGQSCPEGYNCICNPCVALPPPPNPYIWGMRPYILGVVVGMVVLLLLLLAFIWLRKHTAIVPHIPFEELNLSPNSPELERGDLGPVLKGLYRGTAVAVRRILPHGALSHLHHPIDCRDTAFGCAEYELWLASQMEQRRRSSAFWGFGVTLSPTASTANLIGQPLFHMDIVRDKSVASGQLPCDSLDPMLNPNQGLLQRQPSVRQSLFCMACGVACALVPETVGDVVTKGGRRVWHGTAGLVKHIVKPRRRLLQNALLDAQAAVHLRHPNIVAAMGISTEPRTGDLLLVESAPEKGTLYNFLQNDTVGLELDMMLSILRNVVAGMCCLHSSNPPILNPDLSSESVLLDSMYQAQLANWPLHRRPSPSTQDASHVLWTAPELLQGAKPSKASDVYAFGMFMFEVLTRKTPFDGEDPYDVARLVVDPHARVDKRPILPSNVAVNADLAELMQQCWTRDASQRLSFAQIEWRLHEITQGAGCLPEKLLSRNKHEKSLLDQMLPPKVSAALREGRPVEPEAYDCVTIFFSDIVGFTNISGALLPHQVMAMLDRLYKQFDALTKKYELFKVETIGDAYMVVSNLRQPQADHAVRVAEFALDAIDIANQTPVHADRPDSDMLHIRVGFHSGPVVASVVGNVNPRYCLFGDTVNIASRMESTSLADRIHMSAAAAQLLLSQAPQYAGRVVQRAREQTIKGKGAMRTYWLANQDGAQPDPEPPSPNQPRHSSFFDLVRIVQAKLPSMPSTSMEPAQRACSQEVVGEPYSPLPVLRRRLSLGDMQELGEGTPATSLDGWLSPVRSFTLRPQPQAPAEPTQEYPFEEQTGPPSAASAPHEPIVALARKLSGRSPLGLSSPFSHQRREIPAVHASFDQLAAAQGGPDQPSSDCRSHQQREIRAVYADQLAAAMDQIGSGCRGGEQPMGQQAVGSAASFGQRIAAQGPPDPLRTDHRSVSQPREQPAVGDAAIRGDALQGSYPPAAGDNPSSAATQQEIYAAGAGHASTGGRELQGSCRQTASAVTLSVDELQGSYRHTASDITLNMEDSGAAVAGATDGWMHGSYRPAARHGALSMLGSGAVITKPAHGRLEQVRALTPPSGGPSGTGSPSGSFTQRNSFDDNIRVGSVHDALHGRHVPSLLADLSPTSK